MMTLPTTTSLLTTIILTIMHLPTPTMMTLITLLGIQMSATRRTTTMQRMHPLLLRLLHPYLHHPPPQICYSHRLLLHPRHTTMMSMLDSCDPSLVMRKMTIGAYLPLRHCRAFEPPPTTTTTMTTLRAQQMRAVQYLKTPHLMRMILVIS